MRWLDIDFTHGPGADDLRGLAAGNNQKVTCFSSIRADARPLYKNLSVIDLRELRCCLYQNRQQGVLEIKPWIEATVRFSEVNFWCFKRRMRELWGREMAPALTVITAAFLLEAHLVTADFRFLNTVLKLRTLRFFPRWKLIGTETNRIIDLAMAIHEVTELMIEQCRKV